MSFRRILLVFFCCGSFALGANLSAAASPINTIVVSPSFFNPSTNETVKISFRLLQSGNLTIRILDRDGYPVNTLVSNRPVKAGVHSYDWNGRDLIEEIVPDEVYFYKIDLQSNGNTYSHFPSNSIPKDVAVQIDYYDRKRAIVSYKLPRPARVHLQAGVARVNPKTKTVEGPVMKTIVNRDVRSAGQIVEFWNGFNDGDGKIYIPDLPNFKMAIAATELPASSVIAVGNRQKKFIESVSNRKGNSLFTFQAKNHQHHQGLTAVQDSAPELKIKIENAKLSDDEQIWSVSEATLRISGRLEGPTTEAFSIQPGRLMAFMNGNQILNLPPPLSKFQLNIPLKNIQPGRHILAINWVSKYGPATASALQFRREPSTSQQHATKASKEKR